MVDNLLGDFRRSRVSGKLQCVDDSLTKQTEYGGAGKHILFDLTLCVFINRTKSFSIGLK